MDSTTLCRHVRKRGGERIPRYYRVPNINIIKKLSPRIMVEIRPDLPEALGDTVGDSLRVVATHEERDYEFHFRRQDVSDRYTAEEFQRIFDDLVLEGMEREYFEQLFHVGPLECGAWGFRDAVILYFPAESHSGLVVSVDRDGPIDIDGITRTCKDGVIEEETG